MPPRVSATALVSGSLLASLVAVAVRLETGFPPGVTPPPFARLIGQPAPAFALDGLQGGTVSSHWETGRFSRRNWIRTGLPRPSATTASGR